MSRKWRRPGGLHSRGSSAASSLLNDPFIRVASSLFRASDPLECNADATGKVEPL